MTTGQTPSNDGGDVMWLQGPEISGLVDLEIFLFFISLKTILKTLYRYFKATFDNTFLKKKKKINRITFKY